MEKQIEILLLDMNTLKEHEQVNPSRVEEILGQLLDTQYIKPIVVEKSEHVILDGHHRYNALKKLSARFIPAIVVDYEDKNVRLSYWREEYKSLSKKDVINAALSGNKLPPKTSRHYFDFEQGPPIPVFLLL